jgi:methyl-accepting chemotaxis protein
MSQLNQSVGDIAESNHRVEKLAKLIEEIGEKIELIDEIVFQTRLLSFNASVEAERAGEHGRGFAVVAQEIGNLAQMSGKSAAEINHIVKSSIKEAQDVAQTNRDNVGRGVSLCGEATERLASISAASGSILTGSQGILRASEEQNAGVRQINQAIQQISQATQSNASAAEQCSTGSRALAEQVQSLAGIVGGLETLVWGKAFDHSASEGNAADRLSREGHGRTGRAAPGGERAGAAVVPLRRAPAPAQKFAAASDKDQARDNAASAPDEMWEKM